MTSQKSTDENVKAMLNLENQIKKIINESTESSIKKYTSEVTTAIVMNALQNVITSTLYWFNDPYAMLTTFLLNINKTLKEQENEGLK